MADFLKKWSSKKSQKPKIGTKNAVEMFQVRVAEQKAYLEEYSRDNSGFKKWRSTWFQRVPGGFGVTVGRDGVDAGGGLSYVVVPTVKEISDFLDDLVHHSENDLAFQKALEENRLKRVARLSGTKRVAARTSDRSTASASRGTTKAPAASDKSRSKGDSPLRGGRKPKSDTSA